MFTLVILRVGVDFEEFVNHLLENGKIRKVKRVGPGFFVIEIVKNEELRRFLFYPSDLNEEEKKVLLELSRISSQRTRRILETILLYLEKKDWPLDPLLNRLMFEIGQNVSSLKFLMYKAVEIERPVLDLRVRRAKFLKVPNVREVTLDGLPVKPIVWRKNNGDYVVSFWRSVFLGQKVPFFDFNEIKVSSVLREYQKEPFLKTVQKLSEDGGAILQAPTGFGKTVVGSEIIRELIERGFIKTFSVLVPLSVLEKQWYERLDDLVKKGFGEVFTFQYIHYHTKDVEFPRQATTLLLSDTYSERSERIEKEEKDIDIYLRSNLVVIDEVHSLRARTFCRVFDLNKRALRLGLSATPFWLKDKLRESIITLVIGDVVETYTPRQLIELGVLSRVSIDIVKVERGLFEKENENFLSEFIDKAEEIVRVLDSTISRYKEKYRKGMIMVPVKALGRKISERYGIPFVSSENSWLLSELKSKNEWFVVTTPLVQVGFDDPNLEAVVMIDVVSDENRLRQILGRILRKSHVEEKKFVDVCFLDFEESCRKRVKVYEEYTDRITFLSLNEPTS